MRAATPWHNRAESLVMALLLLVSAPGARAADDTAPPTATVESRTLLVMGDSLSAAYGLASEQGWVYLLGQRLSLSHPEWRVVNASISGETTAGGAARIDAALAQHRPDFVAIELGANDALRGLPIEHANANLTRMVEAAKKQGARVLLIGTRIPPNYGPDYAEALRMMYVSLAERHDATLLPFLLEPIAAERDAFLPDNLHPTAASQPKLLEHVWPVMEPLLGAANSSRKAAAR